LLANQNFLRQRLSSATAACFTILRLDFQARLKLAQSLRPSALRETKRAWFEASLAVRRVQRGGTLERPTVAQRLQTGHSCGDGQENPKGEVRELCAKRPFASRSGQAEMLTVPRLEGGSEETPELLPERGYGWPAWRSAPWP